MMVLVKAQGNIIIFQHAQLHFRAIPPKAPLADNSNLDYKSECEEK